MATLIQQFETALGAIAPDDIFRAAGVVEAGAGFDFEAEMLGLTEAAAVRRDEFIAGRRCARAALLRGGEDLVALPRNAMGLPEWPTDWLGSISHSKQLACAVAARKTDFAMLGIDLEKTTRISPAAMRKVLHPSEAAWVGNDQRMGSLLFSIKEAFFKAQYPVIGAQPGFQDLAFTMDAEAGRLYPVEQGGTMPEALRSAIEGMDFRFRLFDDYVVSLCWLRT